jgi:hypothetical protein
MKPTFSYIIIIIYSVKREKMCNNEVVAEARVLLCHDENLHEVKYMEKGALERVLFFVTRTER